MNYAAPARPARGFTLVELLVSMAILALLLLILVSMTDATRRTWTYTSSKIEEFRTAREAFESITRKLGQATLNTYLDYHFPDNNTSLPPDKYIRQSELRFISGPAASLLPKINDVNGGPLSASSHAIFFQAPLGSVSNTTYSNLSNLLNTWGYFVEFGSDKPSWPAFIRNLPRPPAEHFRFRLMELMEPSDSLTLYRYTSGTNNNGGPKCATYNTMEWFTVPYAATAPYSMATRPVRALAENVVAMVLLPKLSPADIASLNQSGGSYSDSSLAPSYLYDTTGTGMNTLSDANLNPLNQLPPIVQVTMVAVDEASFSRYQAGAATRPAPDPLYSNCPFNDSSRYSDNLQQLEMNLRSSRLNYRVFTTNVSIKAAMWSRNQSN